MQKEDIMQKNKLLLGCSQGRLINPFNGELQCFPKGKWKDELYLAKSCGLSYVEFLAEEIHNPENPIWNSNGISELNSILIEQNLIPYSICLDFIIVNSLFEDNNYEKYENYIKEFILASSKINLKLIILPLLKKSSFELYKRKKVLNIIERILKECKKYKLQIAIESIADASSICKLIESINDRNFGCVYDTGNRFSIEKPRNDILKLSKHIKHIHLKDKRNYANVQIGTGEVDFIEVFEALKLIEYKGFFNFETNRGINPTSTMQHNIRYIEFIKEQVNF